MDEREKIKAMLADYLRQKGLRPTKPLRCLNPAHEDQHPSMSYNPRNQTVHCFSCGVTYDIFDLVGIDYALECFPDQYRKAAELFGIAAGEAPAVIPWSKQKSTRPTTLPVRKQEALSHPDRTGELLELMRKGTTDYAYFKQRGLSEAICRTYGLFESGGRAYIPIWENGRCTGWCARAISDSMTPRYQNSTGALGIWSAQRVDESLAGFYIGEQKQILSAGDQFFSGSPVDAAHRFVTEGVIDALTLEQMGYHAIALCGSQNHAKLLRLCEQNLTEVSRCTFVLCGDDDDAGRAMNEALAKGLDKLGLSYRTLALPGGDINETYCKDPERLKNAVEAVLSVQDELDVSAGGSIGAFLDACAKRKAAFSTGFDELDDILDGGIYSGLYIFGAISSAGKTSFVLQLADFIAAHSADVLFFSLEQSKFELMAKTLSRTSALLDNRARRNAFTARQLLRGDRGDTAARRAILEQSVADYEKSAAGLYLREGVADIGTAEIREAVRRHLALHGSAPVVVVDYLQILKPEDTRATDKQNTDRAVVELKRISRDFDIPVLAISSFNRDNYRNAVSMEAFKESGAVEYSSDVLFGIQLAGAGETGFDVNASKAREPRSVELVMLKNRNGVPYAKVKLDYYAKFNLFEIHAP